MAAPQAARLRRLSAPRRREAVSIPGVSASPAVAVDASDPFAPARRTLTVGVILLITLIAFESLGVGTAMPAVARDLDGLGSYGWGFSAFLLAALVGMVAAGVAADRGGIVAGAGLGLVPFVAGSLVAAAAQAWPVLLCGRALQGFGEGALGAVVYVAVARGYPAAAYGRMMALLSTAWVLPSLVGPAVAGLVAEHLGWRWVFVLVLPLVPVAAALALPGLRRLDAPERTPGSEEELRRMGWAVALAAGLGLLLAAPTAPAPAAAALAIAGLALGAPAFARLLPAGTLSARRGLPAGVAARGLVALGYLGCDAFLPLALIRLHGMTLSQAGLVVSAGALSWCAGAILQGRLDRRDEGARRSARAAGGATTLFAGLVVTIAGLVAFDGTPVMAIAGWVVAGLGVGLAYPSVGAVTLALAPAGGERSVSAALQLIEAIGVALFTGAGGALLGAGLEHGWGSGAVALVFACAAAGPLLAIGVACRIVST
jgi:MFS family permease